MRMSKIKDGLDERGKSGYPFFVGKKRLSEDRRIG